MNTADFPWLTIIILFPILAAFVIPLLPNKHEPIRWFALTIGLIDFCIMVYAFYTQYDLSNPNMQWWKAIPG